MGGLIKPSNAFKNRPGAKALFVEGIRYTNAAAKFWPSLIDEISEEFPGCDKFELCTTGAGKLDRALLFPELSLEKGLEALKGKRLQDVMKETLAELELLGPPGSVTVELFQKEDQLLARELPLDCIDSETFPNLLVWPLEWANIASDDWNNASVQGEFIANDKGRGIIYSCFLSLQNTHISEGLYQRRLSISHSVSMLA